MYKLALLLAGAAALVPSLNRCVDSRPPCVPTSLSRHDAPRSRPATARREVLEQAFGAVGAAVLLPKPALADGAVSPATVQRARGIYGSRIAALKTAVEKGDFDAVADEKNAFDLFNSGAFMIKSAIAKEAKATSIATTKEIFAAVEAKDKSKLKSAYTSFMKNSGINVTPVDIATGQGMSTEFDWKARTTKGTIYQR